MNPNKDCPYCPRLAQFRHDNVMQYKNFYNGAVPAFGEMSARLLVVGLAPGLKGANATGRPFTGDYAGEVLYPALLKYGLAAGVYGASPQDGVQLVDSRITNAVRCVPPENKPDSTEIKTCNRFLQQELASLQNLQVILVLGNIAHRAVLMAYGLKQSHCRFAHGAVETLPSGVALLSSYHCSRYNINTGRLTVEMFDTVMQRARQLVDK